jgi:alcohol dehydrogenase class IV
MVATINLPRILRVGGGASKTLAATLAELSLQRPLIITDSFMVQGGYSTVLVEQLAEAGYEHGVFGGCVPDPTSDSVEDALKVLHAGDYDCVIGFGGGSSMDTAKAVAAMEHASCCSWNHGEGNQ